MGWRDVQAGVASGAISYKRKEDKFGDFAEGFASVFVPAMQWKAEAKAAAAAKKEGREYTEGREDFRFLREEKIRKEKERRDAFKEGRIKAKAEEAKQEEYKKNAKAVMTQMGFSPQTEGYHRAFNKAFTMITGGFDVGDTLKSFEDMQQAGTLTINNPEFQGPMPAAGQAMDALSPLTNAESGVGGYDALLNQSQNSQFADKKVSQMKLGDVLSFQTERGGKSYHEWSKTNMPEGTEAKAKGLGSTPAGKYQFIGDTMEYMQQKAWKELKFDENTPFNEETQDALFLWLAQDKMKNATTQQEKRTALRTTWEGIKDPADVSDTQVDEMIAGIETGTFSSDIRSEPIKPGETISFKVTGGGSMDDAGRPTGMGLLKEVSGEVDENGILNIKGWKPINTKNYSSITALEKAITEVWREGDPTSQAIVQREPTGPDLLRTEIDRPESMEGGIFFDPRTQTKFDLAPFIEATKTPGDILAQTSLITAAMETQNIDPAQREAILKSFNTNPYITSVLENIPTQREIAQMSTDDLKGLESAYEANAAVEGAEISAAQSAALKSIKAILASKVDEFNILDFDDIKTPAVQVEIERIEALTSAEEKAENAAALLQLKALVSKRKAEADGTIPFIKNSSTYITHYTNEEGELAQVTTVLTAKGHWSAETGVIAKDNIENTYDLAIVGEQQKILAQIGTTLIVPLTTARSTAATMLASAKILNDYAEANPAILTTVGGEGSRLIKRIENELDALNGLLTKGATDSDILASIDRNTDLSGLDEQARNAVLFEAELYKFAYTFAASTLEQRGAGLSNKDFDKALKIVKSGPNYPTFVKGLKSQVKQGLDTTNRRIMDFEGAAQVRLLEILGGESLIAGYTKPLETWMKDRNLEQQFSWVNSEYVPPAPTEKDAKPVKDASDINTRINAYQNKEGGTGLAADRVVYQNLKTEEERALFLSSFAKIRKIDLDTFTGMFPIIDDEIILEAALPVSSSTKIPTLPKPVAPYLKEERPVENISASYPPALEWMDYGPPNRQKYY